MILHAIGKLALVIDDNDFANGAIIHEDLGELCRLSVAPEWNNPSPVETAELCLKAMRPFAPGYVPNAAEARSANGERVAGTYSAPSDQITVYDRDSRTPGELAEIILHELGHAAGHPLRTGRWVVGVVDPDAPETFAGHEGADNRHEEAVSSLAAYQIATRLGIACRWNLSPVHFLTHMTHLPVARLASVITEAHRSANYILNL